MNGRLSSGIFTSVILFMASLIDALFTSPLIDEAPCSSVASPAPGSGTLS